MQIQNILSGMPTSPIVDILTTIVNSMKTLINAQLALFPSTCEGCRPNLSEWTRVRHVPEGEKWHPVNDNLV